MALSAGDPPLPSIPRVDPIVAGGLVAALACAAPALAVLIGALHPSSSALSGGYMRDAVLGTLGLVLVGGGAATVCGALAAWLVSLCAFPGRGAFEWLLALPLAAPSYVLAYAYASLTWAGGPVDFPVTGFWGAALIYAVGLYPYVYLSARASFAMSAAHALEAARSLGASPREAFWRVGLPLARPAIVAGGALAMMEIAADYGAAQHFGVTTMATAIFRVWYAHGSAGAALQLSALLLLAALAFLAAERSARGRAAFSGGGAHWRTLPRYQLSAAPAWAATVFCALLVVLGAALPLAWLMRLALLHSESNLAALTRPVLNSIALACMGAAATLALAAPIAALGRRAGSAGKAALFAAGMSYAAPGAVIALGALSALGAAREAGWIGGLGGALALATLIWVYAARFAAAGAQPIDAGLARVARGLDASARTLGAGPLRRLIAIDLPVAAPSIAAAALIVFVEILKELPATLILRPFNFETLAVTAYSYASDERLVQSAAPSLLIFAAGLLPMIVLTRGMGALRAGAR